MILLPNADGAIDVPWIAVGETDRWECLDDDNGATSYVKCNDDLASMVIEFQNPSDVGVAEADIDFTQTVSVQFLSSGKAIHRTDPSLAKTKF